MEDISISFISAIIHNGGYKIYDTKRDEGIDLIVADSEVVTIGGSDMHMDSEGMLAVQMKSTTIDKVTFTRTKVLYNLRVANYNKLVIKRQRNSQIPYILILVLFPKERDKWVNIAKNRLEIRRQAFWFYPPKTLPIEKIKAKNSTLSISIPIGNQIDIDIFDRLYKKFY